MIPPSMYRYQLSRLRRGKARSRAPDHHGDEEVPQHRRDRRHQEEKDHHQAVHREQLVVRVGLDEVALRGQQLQADHDRERPAARRRTASPRAGTGCAMRLWSQRQQPGADPELDVQIVSRGRACSRDGRRCGERTTHQGCSLEFFGSTMGGLVSSTPLRSLPVRSERMKAVSCKISSSVTLSGNWA